MAVNPLKPSEIFLAIEPSQTFRDAHFYTQIAQAICIAPTLGSRVILALSSKVAELTTCIPLITQIASTPFKLICEASKKTNGQIDLPLLDKTLWIAPLSGIIICSLAAYKLYSQPSSFLIKGILSGIHSSAMRLFAYAPDSAIKVGIVSLKTVIEDVTLDPKKFTSLQNAQPNKSTQFKQLDSYAETLASTAYSISNIAITYLTLNPILGQTIAYPLAALTKATSMRLFCEIALFYNQNNTIS